MDSLLGKQFRAYHAIVCWLGFQSTFYSSITILSGVYSTLLPYNCSSSSEIASPAAQGQRSSINIQYQLCYLSLAELTSVLFFVGSGAGSIIVGPMSDSIGRVPTIGIGAGAAAAASLFGNYCSYYWLHLVCRGLTGAATAMMQCSVHVYGNEVHTQQHRAKFNFMWGSGMSIGSASSALLAFLAKDHQLYTLVGSTIGMLTMVCSIFLAESPLWLLERGRIDRATDSLRRMAWIDCRSQPSKDSVSLLAAELGASEQTKKLSLLDSLKQLNGRSRLHLVVLIPYALTITVNTYGFAFVISKVVSNVYVYMALKALALLPSAAVMNLAPRQAALCLCGLLGGLLCLCVAGLSLLQPEMSGWAGWAAIGLGLPGTFFGGIGFAVLLTSAAELFPTTVRNTCMGWLYLMTRAGAAVPPALAFLPAMPLRIFVLAVPMLITCWPVLLLPDTRRLQLHADVHMRGEGEENADGLLKVRCTSQSNSQHLTASLAGSLVQL